jgi:fibronectin-binding autotransporter adhesin
VQLGQNLDASTLTLSSGASLSATSVVVDGTDTTLNIGAFDLANATTAGVLQASAVGFEGSPGGATRVINFNQTDTITFQPQITATVTGIGSVVQRGGGTTILNKANTYRSGTTITGGGIIAGNNSALGTGGVSLNGGKLSVQNGISLANPITTGASGAAIGNYGPYAQAAFTGPITLGGTLNISAESLAPARITMTGGFTGTGNIVLGNWDSAALELSGAAMNPIGQLSHVGPGSGAATISAVIGANVTGVIQNSTTSPLILTGANLYSGPTTVSTGLLLANNTTGSATGTGAVAVQAAGTLGGSGFIGGDTTIFGTLSPGNGVGALTFTTNLTLDSGSSTNIELGGLASTAFDRVFAYLAITYGGALNLTLVDGFSPVVGNHFALFGAFNSQSGNFASVTFTNPGFVGSFDPSTGNLTVVAVPEPSTILLFGIGALVFVLRRKATHSSA